MSVSRCVWAWCLLTVSVLPLFCTGEEVTLPSVSSPSSSDLRSKKQKGRAPQHLLDRDSTRVGGVGQKTKTAGKSNHGHSLDGFFFYQAGTNATSSSSSHLPTGHAHSFFFSTSHNSSIVPYGGHSDDLTRSPKRHKRDPETLLQLSAQDKWSFGDDLVHFIPGSRKQRERGQKEGKQGEALSFLGMKQSESESGGDGEENTDETSMPSQWVDHSIDNVMVMLFTHQRGYKVRRRRVMNTWGKHTPHFVTVLGALPPDVSEDSVDGDGVLEVGLQIDDYDNLHKKVTSSFNWICTQKLYEQRDWFMKMDDDAFLVTYNLGEFLKNFDPNEPHYLGFLLKYLDTEFVYASGGAGYLFSKEFMKRMCDANAFDPSQECDSEEPTDFLRPIKFEDVYVALCAKKHINWQFTEGHYVLSPWSPVQVKKDWHDTDEAMVSRWRVNDGEAQEGYVTLHYVANLMYTLYSQFY